MSGETMVPANGVDLCMEAFGEPGDPPVLLIAGGASSMDWWEDEFCRRLAAGGRYVIRYDHRDTGRSTAFPAGAPPYSGPDMARDAVGLLDAIGVGPAHVVGLSMGGGLAQWIAIEEPARLLSLTLMSTSAGGSDEPETPTAGADQAETAGAGVDEPSAAPAAPDEPWAASAEPDGPPAEPETDWSDRKTAVDRLVAEIQEYGGPFTADEPQLRRLAERVFDRTTDMAASQTNHWLIDGGPSIRHRLRTIGVPTLVMHGTVDPAFPMAEAEALAREIPGARLVKLEGVGHEHPPAAVWPQVIREILNHTA
jgi:pimeloyl-ACP methyl ester carboxylesterase